MHRLPAWVIILIPSVGIVVGTYVGFSYIDSSTQRLSPDTAITTAPHPISESTTTITTQPGLPTITAPSNSEYEYVGSSHIWCRDGGERHCYVLGSGQYESGVRWKAWSDPITDAMLARVSVSSGAGGASADTDLCWAPRLDHRGLPQPRVLVYARVEGVA